MSQLTVDGASPAGSRPSLTVRSWLPTAFPGAADAAESVTAVVQVAVPLSHDDSDRLQAALARIAHTRIAMRVELRPEIIGGVWVRIGDTVIDGSIRGRLAALRQYLCAQCQLTLATDEGHPDDTWPLPRPPAT